MKSDFKFSNLLGSVYTRGNLVFTPDGTTLLSPVGNRITSFDLVNNTSFTFPFENRRNVERIALSPQATLLLSVDESGRALLVNYVRRVVLHHFNFKEKVQDIQFAPDSRYFAVAVKRHVQVWRTPSQDREFAPFVKHRQYPACHADITSITWSTDSRFFIVSSKDLTARIFSLHPTPNFSPTTLSGHRDAVVCSFFSSNQESIYTVSRDGALFHWSCKSPLYPKWTIVYKHYFQQTGAKVRCAAFHPSSNILVVGFSTGLFGLYELANFTAIHTLTISQHRIDNVVINKSGEWLAFGSSKLGQLLVWEWQSESYILKQQGHFDSLNALAYSNDGQKIVTASDDGKLKLWDTRSGFCIVTFTEHTAGIEAVEFAKRGTVMFSASLDGSVRAWDLIRYRNFKTFTATSRLQFSCLAVDPSGEVVCAGSIDSFDIHIWSVQTGQLLDRLAGHEGPISALSFAQTGGILVSGSWDKSIRVWDVFGRTISFEPFHQQSDVLSITIRPDGKVVAVATLDGQLCFWDINSGAQVGLIDGRKDISGGRKLGDKITAKTSAGSKAFRTLCYTADGSCIIAGGNSKYVCIYDVESTCLVKKFSISMNLSLDGTLEKLNSKNLTEAGPLELIDQTGDASDIEDRIDDTLPGATRGQRRTRPEIRTRAVRFSPTGRSFAVASTEGLLIYSLDDHLIFDPFDLDIDITPSTTLSTVKGKEYLKALVMSFKLNESYIIHQVYESIPPEDIQLVAKELPQVYLPRLLEFISKLVDESPHVEFHLLWIEALLTHHGWILKQKSIHYGSELRNIQKCVGKIQNELARLSDLNSYSLSYILQHQKVVRREKSIDEESCMMIEDESEWQGFA